MFVLLRDVSAAKRVIATLLATALVLWVSGATSIARADNVQDASDLISDSAPGAASDHTITFTLVNDLANSQSVSVDFDDLFDFTGVTGSDVGIYVDGETFGAPTVTAGVDTISFTNTGGTIASGTLVTITATGTNKIGNPTVANDPNVSNSINGNESYEIQISAGTDTGYTRVVILNTVEITANVDTIFNFTVWENGIGENVNGSNTTDASSTTTIPFGTLVANTPVILSQDLTVETNAINGFVVTAQVDQPLLSSTGADIDEFKDSTLVTDPEVWAAPTTNITDEDTWGHWGITTEDATTTRANEFDAGEWAGVTTSPMVIFSHDGPATPASSVEAGQGSTTIGFQVEISALQEAADDYSTTLTYIATPTF